MVQTNQDRITELSLATRRRIGREVVEWEIDERLESRTFAESRGRPSSST
jgi:hypothetical protein